MIVLLQNDQKTKLPFFDCSLFRVSLVTTVSSFVPFPSHWHWFKQLQYEDLFWEGICEPILPYASRVTEVEREIMNHNVHNHKITLWFYIFSLSFVMYLFRNYQGHIQDEISIVEFYDHQNWLLSCKCCSYDDKCTFILNSVKYLWQAIHYSVRELCPLEMEKIVIELSMKMRNPTTYLISTSFFIPYKKFFQSFSILLESPTFALILSLLRDSFISFTEKTEAVRRNLLNFHCQTH